MKTNKEMLLAGMRKGDFSALLALRDYCEESGDDKLLKLLKKYLTHGEWHAKADHKKFRMGKHESMRRWFRDLAKDINKIEKCWKLPKRWKTGSNAHPFHIWCCNMARETLNYYKDLVVS